ncbi:xanthine dehydrogenase molybdopterin binding subunit [Oleiharenicola lentus]|uniref:xanthine dehydrogenase n=1 Tax=Oleiharenicola lentus TaxID=2508720 RepID=A0A4Q1C9T4_9BACT|nr:xanthine dehydrogenase molybdopterin binding subunit [Oleiharenicola lentus]RXK55601.1 xanthine dehydrogenase molybdopterin binding subunit [Oleiharenicola lentus]
MATTSFFEFILNGAPVRVEGLPPTTTLLDWLRTTGRTGSKQGCAEGDCGACTVALVERDAAGKPTYRALNSCIALLPMFAGREVVTVEGLAGCGAKDQGQGTKEHELHPVQSCMVKNFGSQCGYCTPGFVMSLFEGHYRKDCTGPAAINDQLCGNLCRCTGYRAIRDAALEAFNPSSVGSALAPTSRTKVAASSDPTKDKFAARLKKPVPAPTALDYAAGPDRFLRPTTLGELFRLQRKHPGARLVAGATEIGVELNKKFKAFPLLLSTEAVRELTQIRKTTAGWRIGAAVTLTAIEEKVVPHYPPLAKMLRVFAARQIRNRATLGGNIATASPIGDSAPLLLALDASLVLASARRTRTVALADFFTGYRQTALKPGELIKEIILPKFAPGRGLKRRADFVKVSHRQELDISIVAGAFCVDTDRKGIVRSARLAYGGVAERPKRALKTEALLIGKKLTESVDAVAETLTAEFTPIDDVRSGAAYRRGLVVSLWQKFISGEQSLVHDLPPDYAYQGPWPVDEATKALRHESAVGHVTGRALYVDDTAQRRPMLDVWPVMAPHSRAKILRRDASAARKAPGVVSVLLAEDIPGENNTGPARHDEPLFAKEEVCFHGQVVALVVGESPKACREAAALVKVDYEPLPPLLGIQAAIAANSFHTDWHALKRGDAAAALAAAPQSFAGEFEFGGQEHFYLETQAAWAEPGEDDTVLIHSSTQHPSEIQAIVSEILHLPRHKIVVQAPRMGGGFGGKETQGNAIAAYVALAARRTGRPVRLQLDRDLDMALTGKRHPFHAKFRIGHDAEGRVLAAQVELVSDGGWSLDLSLPIADRALFHLDNAYYLPAVDFRSRVAKTNVTSHTAFRGFGGPQGIMVIEEIMDRVARRTGLAPEVVRARNLYHGIGETNRTHYHEDIGDNRIQAMWKQALDQAMFAERRASIADWNRTHARIKRGLAITPVKFGISFTLTHYNQAGALVLIYQDGSVQVNHGGTEMGQGLHTKILGIAARELGLPASAIRMMTTSTDKVPNTSATAASSGADLNGMAVAAACTTLRERLAPVAAGLLAAPADDIVFSNGEVFPRAHPDLRLPFAKVCAKAYTERVSLSATGYYKTPGIHWDWNTATGRPFHYFACGVAVAEVEVDGHTGMQRVRRVDVVHDVGDSLNPGIDRGQIEGGFVQGLGWLTSEELKWDAKGRLLTHSASTYQIPAMSDAPPEFNVTLMPRAGQANTIHGSKAVGEPPLMLAFSVREAIRDAVAAFGPASGEVHLESPATGEAIFAAIQARLKAGQTPKVQITNAK